MEVLHELCEIEPRLQLNVSMQNLKIEHSRLKFACIWKSHFSYLQSKDMNARNMSPICELKACIRASLPNSLLFTTLLTSKCLRSKNMVARVIQ